MSACGVVVSVPVAGQRQIKSQTIIAQLFSETLARGRCQLYWSRQGCAFTVVRKNGKSLFKEDVHHLRVRLGATARAARCSPAPQRLLSFIFMPPSATMVDAQFFETPSKRGVDSTCEAAFSQEWNLLVFRTDLELWATSLMASLTRSQKKVKK